MNTQDTLFDLDPLDDQGPACLELQTGNGTLSAMADKRTVRRLATLAAKVETTGDPIKRAALAAEVRDIADQLVADSIHEANGNGLTWRQIGAELGTPFQTLYRRYGAR